MHPCVIAIAPKWTELSFNFRVRYDAGQRINNWIVQINGLVYSQRKAIATQNPEFTIDEQTGELNTIGSKDPVPGFNFNSRIIPISKITAYLNLLANLKYKVASCVKTKSMDSTSDGYLWTLQSV